LEVEYSYAKVKSTSIILSVVYLEKSLFLPLEPS